MRKPKSAFVLLCCLALAACGGDGKPAPKLIKGPVIPTAPGEKLAYLVPAGWHTAHVVQSLQVNSIEYVPPGQDRQQWTDMVTAAWMDRTMYHRLADVAATLQAILAKRCAVPPVVSDPQYTEDNDYHVTTVTISCGKTPEGYGHIAIIKTIKSDNGYYQLQRAWRKPAVTDSHALTLSYADTHAADEILGTLHLTAVPAAK